MNMKNKQIITVLFVFIMGMFFTQSAYCAGSNDDEETKSSPKIKVDYSDVALFYSVIEKAQRDGKKITGKYMYENYVRKSSDGLKDGYAKIRTDVFPMKKDGSIDYSGYDTKIKSLLPFFVKNRDVFMNQKPIDEEDLQSISTSMCEFLGDKFCSKYLQNKTVYFSVSGALNMAGTAFENGVFIDVSMVYDEAIDYTTLSPREQAFASNFPKKSKVTHLVIHEFFHTFQSLYHNLQERQKFNFIKISLTEGGGDFFATSILSRAQLMEVYHDQEEYMKKNPQKYSEFWNDIKMNDEEIITEKWIYNGGNPKLGDKPADLGYYIGRKVMHKFFEEETKTRSREAVLKQILKLKIPNKRIEKIIRELAQGM